MVNIIGKHLHKNIHVDDVIEMIPMQTDAQIKKNA